MVKVQGLLSSWSRPCRFNVSRANCNLLWYGDNMEQHTYFETLLELRMLDKGIIPCRTTFGIGVGARKEDVKARMATLDPISRRKAARKFRKMWRKAAHHAIKRAESTEGLKGHQRTRHQHMAPRLKARVSALFTNRPGIKPTPCQQQERSRMVTDMVMRQIRDELLELMRNREKKSPG